MTTAEYEKLLAELKPAAEKRLRNKHRLSREDRDDVLQESLVYLVKAMEQGKVREPAALLNSILDLRVRSRIAANKERLEVESATGDFTELLQDSAAQMGVFGYIPSAGAFSADEFDSALRALPQDEQAAFILMDLRGVKKYEAAQLLGLPASTVRGQRDRARNFIRKELQ